MEICLFTRALIFNYIYLTCFHVAYSIIQNLAVVFSYKIQLINQPTSLFHGTDFFL